MPSSGSAFQDVHPEGQQKQVSEHIGNAGGPVVVSVGCVRVWVCACVCLCECVCVCVCVCVWHACMHACVRACAPVRIRVRVCVALSKRTGNLPYILAFVVYCTARTAHSDREPLHMNTFLGPDCLVPM
jgi:hypothetical protein